MSPRNMAAATPHVHSSMGEQNANIPACLTFEDVQLEIVDRCGHPWLTQTDLARALYGATDETEGGCQDATPLKRAVNTLRRLFDRNRDEFTGEMTALLTMETAGGPQQVRIYSARGAYLMAMFAKTDRAKRFRVWVLDVLEGKTALTGSPTLAERRVRVMELNAANRAIDHLVKTGGRRAARDNLKAVYGKVGLSIDLSNAQLQGEFDLGTEGRA